MNHVVRVAKQTKAATTRYNTNTNKNTNQDPNGWIFFTALNLHFI